MIEPVTRVIGLCLHWAFSGVPASTSNSDGARISKSGFCGFGTFIGGGGAGRDFLCRCLKVPVPGLAPGLVADDDLISSFNC